MLCSASSRNSTSWLQLRSGRSGIVCPVVMLFLANHLRDEVVPDFFHVNGLRGLVWALLGLVVEHFSG